MNSITDATTGKFIDVNENFIEFCGLSKEEIIGKSSLELNLIANIEQREEIINSIKKKGYSKDMILEINSNRGTKWISVSGHAVNIAGKDCFLTAMIDITERKKSRKSIGLCK